MVRADQSETVAKKVADEVISYITKKGVTNKKDFGIFIRKSYKYLPYWAIILSISHHVESDFVYKADEYMEKHLNNTIKIPYYRIIVNQDTTYKDQNFHIRLVTTR